MEDAFLPAPDPSAKAQAKCDIPAEVLAEQVRLIYANLPVSQFVALLNGVVLAIVLSYVLQPAPVIGWLAALICVTVARIFIGALFRRAHPSAKEMSLWRVYFFLGVGAAGMVWGSTAWLLYPLQSIIHEVFIAFVVGGMVVGAVPALTPIFSAFALFATCALLPTITSYLLTGDYIHNAMTVMGAVFLLAMLVIGKRIHNTIAESLKLRFENKELITYLTSNREHLQSINRDLLAAHTALTSANQELESRVAERTSALQAADRRKDEFLAMLSHELRNPLAPIRNSIYILNHVDPVSEHAQSAKEIIERQTQHMTRLVDDLLDVTRIARGKIGLRRERVDLADLLRRTVQDYSSVFEQFGIELVTIVPELPVWANVDPTRIAQLVGNLLQNASKFTPAAGKVKLSFKVVEECAEIRVSDTGPGIDPHLLPSLFEPFMQGKQSLARREGGLGLGLALVKGIVELHDGTVRVDTGELGKGAEFIVRWPLVLDHIAQDEPAAIGHEISRNCHVLVVDDNSDAADSLAQLVEMFGHTAEVAYDGTTALEKVRIHSPDVVLCDLGLPGLSGYEVAGILRADGNTVRLIAVSGYAAAAWARVPMSGECQIVCV